MKAILGTKETMTQIFSDDGKVIPVTVVKAGTNFITALKTKEKDGYSAVQIGHGTKKNISKPLAGHLGKMGKIKNIKELRCDYDESLKVGDKVSINTFDIGDKVNIKGLSKGKGFQGVVKRHGFKGAPASHGTKDQVRMPGSIGCTGPAHVFKGVRMAGQTGNQKVTVKNLEIIKIDPEQGYLFIKGAIPGSRNSLVMIVGEGELKVNESEVKSLKDEELKTTDQEEETINKEQETNKEIPEEKPEIKEDKAQVQSKEEETAQDEEIKQQ
jgi:large subunit ribosomal protein L3